jgi:hypothetical protein
MSERSGAGGQENQPPHFISQRDSTLLFSFDVYQLGAPDRRNETGS